MENYDTTQAPEETTDPWWTGHIIPFIIVTVMCVITVVLALLNYFLLYRPNAKKGFLFEPQRVRAQRNVRQNEEKPPIKTHMVFPMDKRPDEDDTECPAKDHLQNV